MKLSTSSAVLLSQFVRAEAGVAEAQYDARLCAVFGAYLQALQHGNKSQLQMVEAHASAFSTPKACRELTDVKDRTTPAATRASKIYQAYGFAVAQVGIPAVLRNEAGKKAGVEACEQEAEKLAVMFTDVVTAALTPEEKAVKTEAEKEAEKAAREAKKAEKDAAVAQAVEEKVRAELASADIDVSDMAKSVEMAILTGTLDAASMEALYAALAPRFAPVLEALPA